MEKTEQNQAEKGKQLDQFFTKDSVAIDCLDKLIDYLSKNAKSKYRIESATFFEPSAGGSAFIRALKANNCEKIFACDLDPCCGGIVRSPKNHLPKWTEGHIIVYRRLRERGRENHAGIEDLCGPS